MSSCERPHQRLRPGGSRRLQNHGQNEEPYGCSHTGAAGQGLTRATRAWLSLQAQSSWGKTRSSSLQRGVRAVCGEGELPQVSEQNVTHIQLPPKTVLLGFVTADTGVSPWDTVRKVTPVLGMHLTGTPRVHQDAREGSQDHLGQDRPVAPCHDHMCPCACEARVVATSGAALLKRGVGGGDRELKF